MATDVDARNPTPSLPGPANPYVGPQPFGRQQSDRFFGRAEEVAILRGMVMARRLTLLFAQSGAGKSSLLEAGLIPQLEEQVQIGRGPRRRSRQRMQVLPTLYVSSGASAQTGLSAGNIYVQNALHGLLPAAALAELSVLSLTDGVAQYAAAHQIDLGNPADPAPDSAPAGRAEIHAVLLIFDQFEEVFTFYPTQRTARANFFQQVEQALQTHPKLHILFSMREDYLAELTPYLHLVRERLIHRFRLEPLTRQAALQAIMQPAAGAGRTYAPNVAEQLVNDLARIQVSQRYTAEAAAVQAAAVSAAATATQSTPAPLDAPMHEYIEPVHLQIVCRQLWENLPPERTIIGAADLQQFGDVTQALAQFYVGALHKTMAATALSERLLRKWFSEELITPSRVRGLVYHDEEAGLTNGLPNAAVDILRDAYIIRANIRSTEAWFELAHDRLVEPVLASNTAWLESYHNPLAAPTADWLAAGQHPDKLLRGTQLAAAHAFAQANPADLLADEARFLTESQRLQARLLEEERQKARRQRQAVLTGVAVLAVLTVLTIWALLNSQEARRQRDIARSGQLAALARNELTVDHYDSALLLAAAAGRMASTDAAFNAMRLAMSRPARTEVIMVGHSKPINDAAWSPDESQVATASDDATARTWDARSGEVLHLFAPHGGQVTKVRWSSDGAHILTACADGIARLWDARNGRLLYQLPHNADDDNAITDIDWSPDNRRILTASKDAMAIIWDAESGEQLHLLKGHTSRVASAQWSHGGDRVVTAGADRTIRIWDVETGAELFKAEGFDEKVEIARWSPNDAYIATAHAAGPVRVWSVENQEEPLLVFIQHPKTVISIEWSNTGNQIVSTSQDGTIRVWDALNSQIAYRFDDQGSNNPKSIWGVNLARWSESAQKIALAGKDGTAHIWQADTGNVLVTLADHSRELLDVSSDEVSAVAWSQDGQRLLTASYDTTARIWRLAAASELPTFSRSTSNVSAAVWNHDESWLLTASQDGTASVWNAQTGVISFTVSHPATDDQAGGIWQAKWNQAETQILTAGGDGTARLWNAANGAPMAVLGGHMGRVEWAWWNRDESRIRTGDYDYDGAPPKSNVNIWDTAHLDKPIAVLEGHTDLIETARWNRDETRMVTASRDGTVRLWDTVSGEELDKLTHSATITDSKRIAVHEALWNDNFSRILTYSNDGTSHLLAVEDDQLVIRNTFVHTADITIAAWNRTETRVLTASKDGFARVWPVNGVRPLHELPHPEAVTLARWSHDESFILTVADDNALRIWDAASGDLLQTLYGHTDSIWGAVWSRDDTHILTFSEDRTARIWRNIALTGNRLAWLWGATPQQKVIVLYGHAASVLDARWNQDETRILTRSRDGSVRQYFTDIESLIDAVCKIAPRNFYIDEKRRFFGDEQTADPCSNLALGTGQR
ncbi:MAG: WD40 repeat domain-containing protein [Caldilineaceae bacterium]